MNSTYSMAIHPWLRFLARNIDLNLFFIAVYIFLFVVYPNTAQYLFTNQVRDGFFWVGSVALWIGVETLLLATWGTTPGKWFFGIRVLDKNQNTLNLKQAFRRSIHVWFTGMGMGVLVLSVFTWIYSYYYLLRRRVTPWDRKLNVNVICDELHIFRLILFIVVFFSAVLTFYYFARWK